MQVLDSVTLELRLEAGEKVWLDVEWGREEECVAAEPFVQGEEGEVQQGTQSEDQGEDRGEVLQAQVQLFLWQEGLLQVVARAGHVAREGSFHRSAVGEVGGGGE